MEIGAILLVAVVVFGICFVVDKGFTKLFRNRPEHKTGLAVRLNKKNGSFGLIIAVLGVAALFAYNGNGLLLAGGIILILLGGFLVTYYMTFGLFYDQETFVLTTFGKRSDSYRYQDIVAQQLYQNYGTIIVELHLNNGRTVQLQSSMDGVYPFLDHAFSAWLRQTGRNKEDCDFYDPANSCWFPPVEEK